MDPHHPTERRRRRPRPLTARMVIAGGAALIGLLFAVVGASALYEYKEAREVQQERAALLARLLEEHATASLDSASAALATIAERAERMPADQLDELAPALARLVGAQPLFAAVALVDERDTVVAASTPQARGRRLDSTRLAARPGPGAETIGAPLTDATALGVRARTIPMLHAVGTRADGRRLLLVALLDEHLLARHQRHAVGDPGTSAWLVLRDGQVLNATPDAQPGVGQRLEVPAPAGPLQQHEGSSASGGHVLAWHELGQRPALLVVVARDLEVALSGWRALLRWLVAAVAAAAAVIVAMTIVAERSVRARETARRQRDAAQQAVAQRERELSVIVKSVQELIFRTDAQGRLTFVNARWHAATGLAAAGLLGRTLASLVDEASRPAATALLAPGDGGTRAAQLMFGGTRSFDVAVSPLQEGGQLVGYAGSAVDVTARCAAERELQNQLALSALMLDTIPLPVALMDREARYVAVNRAWEQLAGAERQALIGKQVRDYLVPAEAEQHERHNRELLARGGVVRYEAEATTADGSRRTMAVTKAAVPGDDGRPRGLLATLDDITEFREADRTMREARDMAEEASRAKSEFIANISHELRTPLQAIIGFSELGMVRGRAQERLASMFGDIHAAGQRMLALVNDLLDVSKIESTVGTFHLERTDLRPLIREVVREIDPLLARRRLHLDLTLSDGPLVAKVDPLRFQQVVRNVLANAVRFSPDGAVITVGGDIDERHEIVVTVRDHGPGIPPAELEQIFEAFVQSSKTKDGSGGTGLGLAICRKILEAHGGRIQAENVAGGGSRFVIALPARGFADTLV
ncbi:PAS domain-containing sensor histidine kinase [Rubrivivax gelatinosus]|nr:PAS domain-containing sensor histidine kinase [Rubrivivax gelatinosus]